MRADEVLNCIFDITQEDCEDKNFRSEKRTCVSMRGSQTYVLRFRAR